MILNSVRLYLNADEFESSLKSEFLFRSCYVSNYLTRRVKSLRYSSDGFKAILVQGSSLPDSLCRISSENNLIAQVGFRLEGYKSQKPAKCHEFFLGMLLEGIEKSARQHKVPLNELKSAIEEFRNGGYRNEWIHKKKVFRAADLVALLHCSLDTKGFNLTLKLDSKNGTIFEKVILSTKPDELIFAHKFKDVQLVDGSVVVSDKFGKSAFSVRLDSLRLPSSARISTGSPKSRQRT